jgi:Tol biopolymer transport system component
VRRSVPLLTAVAVAVAFAAALTALVIAERPATAAFPGNNGDIAFSKAPGGFGHSQIFRMNPNGSNPEQLTNFTSASAYDPQWSSRGTRLAFVVERLTMDFEIRRDIWVMKADGSDQTNLTSSRQVNESSPSWFPGGRKIAFASDRNGKDDIYVATLNRAGELVSTSRLTRNAAADFAPAVSPDGSRIAFVSNRAGGREIFVMRTDAPEGSDNRPKRLTGDKTRRETSPDWAPGGHRIAFEAFREGNGDIFTKRANGEDLTRITRHPAQEGGPAWSPNGNQMAFWSTRSGSVEMWKKRLSDGETVSLEQPSFTFSWQPLP